MKVLFLNNEGGGFADYVEVEPDTTVQKLFATQLPGREAHDFLIRVNRQHVAAEHVLAEGDRVSMTPTKIEGATPEASEEVSR
jgi:hypothetical protein